MKRILLGLSNLPYYGRHPGTVPLLFMTLMGLCFGGIRAAVATLLVFGVMYLFGAYQRGDEHLRRAKDQE